MESSVELKEAPDALSGSIDGVDAEEELPERDHDGRGDGEG